MIRQTARFKVAAATLLTLAALSGCGDKDAAKPKDAATAGAKAGANVRSVRTALVERRALAGGVSASGVLVSREEAAVSAEALRSPRLAVRFGANAASGTGAAPSSFVVIERVFLIARAGGTPRTLDVDADVTLGPDPAGGFRITGIVLTVRGQVDGLDAAGFRDAAEQAKAGCPVSKALTGTEITLDAALA